MKITISKQFQDLIYPLTQEEIAVLEQSILKQGVRDPLVVWSNGRDYLIDGHHRKQLIDKHKITKYKITKLKFNNKYEVISWILDTQLGRRNCSPEGISYLRGLRYKNEKLLPHRPKKGEKISPLKTSERLAEQYKITSRTIYNDEKFADAIETVLKAFSTPAKQKDIKYKILTRQISLSKKDILELAELSPKYIKQVVSGEKELWAVKLEIEQRRRKRKKKAVRIILPKDIKMFHGDCLKILPKLEENSIDAGLLDPPYGVGIKKGKELENFTPANIEKYNLIEQSYFIGNRSAALKAGLYDLSYEGGKKYQRWCEQWGRELLRVIKPGGHILVFCSPRMFHRMCCGMEDAGWEVRTTLVWAFGTGFPVSLSVSQSIDKLLGKKGRVICENINRKNRVNWDKNDKNILAPATEEAEKWEEYYSGLKSNLELILLARKPLAEKSIAENILKFGVGALNIGRCRLSNGNGKNNSQGRYPANAIFSEEAGKVLDMQAGQQVSQYFYCPKPSDKEKNMGCEDTGNTHPTIKPVKLISWLLCLISNNNSTVIDCFCGSGTTGMASAYNNFKFIGIEKEKSYYQIARRRIMAAYRKQQGK